MNTILAKAEQTHQLTEAELVRLLTDPDAAVPLYAAADRVRQKYVGDQVELRGLIEFSNICKQNCLYCGLRRDNRQIPRYRLDGETILEFGRRAAELGYKTLVMQSGEDEAHGHTEHFQYARPGGSALILKTKGRFFSRQAAC